MAKELKMNNNTLIIGAGNLGSAIAYGYESFINNCREKIYIYDINQNKKNDFKKNKHIIFVKDLSIILKKSKCIIMAVKPKDYKGVCKIIKEDINKNALVLSVMAGVKLKSLKKELPSNTKFVRLMTNLNIKIFQGSSFIYANKEVKNIDKKRIENFWSSLGTVHWLKTESKIDKFTALIGSGPAYLIYFCECLVRVFKDFGLTEKDAAMHVQQLLLGTALLTYYDNEKFNYLNKKIASKGGTTQEALDILAKGKLTSILNKAIKAAYKKAKSLEDK